MGSISIMVSIWKAQLEAKYRIYFILPELRRSAPLLIVVVLCGLQTALSHDVHVYLNVYY